MKMRIVFVICFGLAAVVSASAQGRPITNLDLAKYAEARLNAEKELRENYAQLGFASPEERARHDAADAKERAELSARLRRERIERDVAEAGIEELRTQQARNDAYLRAMTYSQPAQEDNSGYLDYGYGYPGYGSYGGYGGYGNYGNRGWFPQQNPTWRTGGGVVIYGGQPGGIGLPTVRPFPTRRPRK